MTGTVLKGVGGLYFVRDEAGNEFKLHAQNKIRRIHLKPLVGDRVEFEPGSGEELGWLTCILPRKNVLVRPPVANIDAIVITVSASAPQADLLLTDRLLLSARASGIKPFLVINKSDEDRQNASDLAREYSGADIECFAVSAKTGEGLTDLSGALTGLVHAFAGQSGVGKSSLVNALYGFELEVGSISDRIERGKHTTRASSLIPVSGGGAVLDTPGFSLLETELIEPVKLAGMYPEFTGFEGKCRFSPCTHVTEPDCPVKTALAEGRISRGRYERYILLLDEMKERWSKRYD